VPGNRRSDPRQVATQLLNFDRFRQPRLFTRCANRARWGLSSPYHVAATYPQAARPSPSVFGVLTTPTRRYHGILFIQDSPPGAPFARGPRQTAWGSPWHSGGRGRRDTAGSGPLRARRRLLRATPRGPHPLGNAPPTELPSPPPRYPTHQWGQLHPLRHPPP